MNLFKSGIPFLAALFLFAACKDDENPKIVDITPPTIANVQHPEAVEPGDEFELTFVLEDNIALGELRLDIHDDFDGHEHEGGRFMATPFEYSNVYVEMRGEERYVGHIHIDIPTDAATGPYHLQINYTDDAGNEGELYVSTFEIADPALSPSISITNFPADAELEPAEDGILYLEGSVEDPDGLDEVHIMVMHEDESHGHERLLHEEPVYEQEWMLEGATSFNLQNIDPAIDLSAAEAGHYDLQIMARDMEGHTKVYHREVHID